MLFLLGKFQGSGLSGVPELSLALSKCYAFAMGNVSASFSNQKEDYPFNGEDRYILLSGDALHSVLISLAEVDRLCTGTNSRR